MKLSAIEEKRVRKEGPNPIFPPLGQQMQAIRSKIGPEQTN